MDAADRAAIEGLFARLADFEERAAARDPQADAYVARCLQRQPGAAYFMAQTIIAQEQALKQAEARLAAGAPAARDRAEPQARPGPWGARAAGGGFLAGTAQTAMGVAGGVILASVLSGLFGGDAEAADASADPADDDGFGDDGLGDDIDL